MGTNVTGGMETMSKRTVGHCPPAPLSRDTACSHSCFPAQVRKEKPSGFP